MAKNTASEFFKFASKFAKREHWFIGGFLGEAWEAWENKPKTPKKKNRKSWEYCGDCDGVGWVEGGKFIQTTCKTCTGTGKIKLSAMLSH